MNSIKLFILPLLFIVIESNQSPKKIHGIVVDANGIRIPSCSLSIKGTKIGTTTDKCGEFDLVIPSTNFVLSFCCISAFSTEGKIKLKDLKKQDTLIFQYQKYRTFVNKECKDKVQSSFKIIKLND